MKRSIIYLIFAIAFFSPVFSLNNVENSKDIVEFKNDSWFIHYTKSSGKADIYHQGILLLKGVSSEATTDKKYTSGDYTECKFNEQVLTDEYGAGTKFTFEHTAVGKPTMKRIFYLYDSRDYFLTELQMESPDTLSSNFLVPITTSTPTTFHSVGENRILFIPYDNDKWVRYKSSLLKGTNHSYEVTAIYNPQNRAGLVLGSVNHDTWKSGINVESSDGCILNKLDCYSGVADEFTRDVLPHGKVKGKTICSPKILVGFFNDWRDGMEQFGKVCSATAPKLSWEHGTPFGWNSWGKMQFKMTFDKVIEVSDYFKASLQDKGFSNDKTVYIGMDSGWNRMTDEQLKAIVDHCKANGQKAGIYFTPFTDWGKKPNKEVDGATGYTFKDAYLYANGKPQELDGAWALDPTHPAVQQRIAFYANKFKKAGFEYLKIDFLTHGALESDYHYEHSVTTGMQAYNVGMAYVLSQMSGMYITMAISPLFPSQYAHSRRIACDAFGKIKDVEYTLNAVSYGWWLNQIYTFNDPDHIVLEGAAEGENRARVTSGIITGIYMLGDDFSNSGLVTTKEKSGKFATNKDINDIARIGKTFRPVNGYNENSENIFMLRTKDYLYIAAFNYGDENLTFDLSFKRLNLKFGRMYSYKELWSGLTYNSKNNLKVVIPSKDIKLFRFDLKKSKF